MAQTEIVHDDATLRIGVTRNLVVFAWSGAPEAKHVRSLSRALQLVAARRRHAFATLDIVVSGTPQFTDEVRQEMVKLLRDPHLQGQATAHVVEMGGLPGTAVRAFLSTILLLSRPSAPNKVFGDVATGAPWLVPFLSTGGEVWSPADVLLVAAEVTGKSPRPLR